MILNFLFENASKTLEPERWAALLGVEIIDWDGWRGKGSPDWREPCGLLEFVKRVSECTIAPVEAPRVA